MLLDTCTLIWMVANHSLLSDTAKKLILDHSGLLFVSAITAFEIGVKSRKGKLDLPLSPGRWFERALELHGLSEVPVDWRIAEYSTSLPTLHRDPCDRMLIATAQLRELCILTPDPLIHAYSDVDARW